MIKIITFAIVFALMAFYIRRLSGAGASKKPSVRQPKKAKKRPLVPQGEFWTQVYDTDLVEEANKIQEQFTKLGIPCLVYEQGKKNVYGERPKHFGVSVPRQAIDKAQTTLSELTL